MRKQMIKHLSAFAMLFYCGSTTYSQDILWEKSYGGKQTDYLFNVVPTPDYGFILVGSSQSKKSGTKTEGNRGDLDYWVWKMDENGDAEWQKTFGGLGQDKLRTIVLTYDGGYLLAGSSTSGEGLDKKDKNRGQSDFWLIKLNAQGGEEWQKTIGGSGQDELTAIVKSQDGGFIIGGSSTSGLSGEKQSKGFGAMDYWLLKLDTKGEIVWQNMFGGSNNDELRSITITPEGGYLLGGSSNSPDNGSKLKKNIGLSDYWIIMTNKDGQELWQKTIGGSGDDQLYAMEKTADGGYLLGGSSNSEASGDKRSGAENGTDFWILKLDKDGIIVWQENYDTGKVDILSSLIVNDDQSILIGGYVQGEVAKSKDKAINKRQKVKDTVGKTAETPKMKKGTGDYLALKVNDKGEELWKRNIGSEGEEILRKVIETRDGGYLMAGTSKGKISDDRNSGIGGDDFWVVKLKDKQKTKEKKNPIEAIPNPATDYTNVIVGYEFTKGTATLVDLAGHVLQTFDITERTVPINLQGLPEGLYIVNIKTDKQSDGVKVLKVRNKN